MPKTKYMSEKIECLKIRSMSEPIYVKTPALVLLVDTSHQIRFSSNCSIFCS